MIQDIAPHSFSNSYQTVMPSGDSLIFVYCNGLFLLKGADEQESGLPSYRELPAGIREFESRYLFTVDSLPVFLLLPDMHSFSCLPYQQVPVSYALDSRSVWLPLIITTAAQLANWYRTRQYCGRCGRPMHHSNTERAMCCTRCGNIEYPRISPVVIVAITHKRRLLMAHYADRNIKPLVLISGFVEIGETLEAAAQREALEEVGLHICDLKYFGSQPWGFSSSLATGFFAETAESNPDIILDTHELADAAWFSPEQIPHELNNGSLTAAMIEAFRNM